MDLTSSPNEPIFRKWLQKHESTITSIAVQNFAVRNQIKIGCKIGFPLGVCMLALFEIKREAEP